MDRPSVLLIDDDPHILELMRAAFDRRGYRVTTASTGATGLKAFAAEPSELVVTDIVMPDGEGIETIMELRRRNPKVKILAVSGGGRIVGESYLNLVGHLGADATLAKPFRMGVLTEVAERLLGQAAVGAA